MKTTLITLKVSGVLGGDGKPRVCCWWYLPGGNPLAPDGGVCCDDLGEALRHVGIAIEEDQLGQPDVPLPADLPVLQDPGTQSPGRQPALPTAPGLPGEKR